MQRRSFVWMDGSDMHCSILRRVATGRNSTTGTNGTQNNSIQLVQCGNKGAEFRKTRVYLRGLNSNRLFATEIASGLARKENSPDHSSWLHTLPRRI
jgi:hypothetical protein